MRALIVAAMLTATGAGAQTFEDWSVERFDQDGSFGALTVNSSGGLLGKLCTFDGCKWVVTLKANCKEDGLYPALLSSKSGAYHVTLRCEPNAKVAGRYIFTDFEVANNALSEGEMVGLAFPMESGDFRVSRFSLRGFYAATNLLAIRVRDLVRQGGERRL